MGEEFDVYGYPTVVVLSPDREEITRIATTLETAPYVRALDVALAASQPAAAAYAAVLSGVATDSDLRLLGYYSWGQDNERLVPESQLPATLKALEAAYPPHLAVEKSRLFMAYLAARAVADSEQDKAPALTGAELRWARTRLQEILDDPALIEANFLDIVYGAHWVFAMVADPVDAGAAALAAAWDAALAGVREDPATPAVTRIGTLYGTLCLFTTRQPGHMPPSRLIRAVHKAVREADGATKDPYARSILPANHPLHAPPGDLPSGEWDADGIRAPSVARIRAEVLAICDGMADDGPSRATCRTFLAEQSPEPSI